MISIKFIGERHLTDPDKIKVSHIRDQRSLNSIKAIRCLSKLKIVACQPEGTHAKKSIIKQLLLHVRSLESVIDNNRFLLEIHDELMAIGNLTSQQADKVLRKSLATLQLNPIMMHEPAAYWSFSILYGRDKLWHKEYEIYMRKKNRVRK